jgi:ribosomal RNA-processing protein 12
MDASISDVHAEIKARHGHSAQPESLQLKAILQAVTEVIQAQGMEVTPLTLFAATMSALEKPESLASPQVGAESGQSPAARGLLPCARSSSSRQHPTPGQAPRALSPPPLPPALCPLCRLQITLPMCSLLAVTLARVPSSVVRSKFAGCAAVITAVLEKHREQVRGGPSALARCRSRGERQGIHRRSTLPAAAQPTRPPSLQASVAKSALQCLGQVLSALDPANWAAALAPYSLLLAFTTDARPKVRKRAQASLVEVLAAARGGPAAGATSEALLRTCQRVLPGPEAAARAAAAASNKQRAAAEEAITRAVADALHLLALLKQVLPLLAGESVPTRPPGLQPTALPPGLLCSPAPFLLAPPPAPTSPPLAPTQMQARRRWPSPSCCSSSTRCGSSCCRATPQRCSRRWPPAAPARCQPPRWRSFCRW